MIIDLKAVVDGEIIKIEEVSDPIFSEKMIGDGYAIIPTSKKLFSPITGKIEEMAHTKHAIYLSTDSNEKILIHIGINTIELEGIGFSAEVETGESVEKGDLLVTFDPKDIQTKGYNPVVSVILLDQKNQEKEIEIYPEKKAIANETVALTAKIYKK